MYSVLKVACQRESKIAKIHTKDEKDVYKEYAKLFKFGGREGRIGERENPKEAETGVSKGP